MKDVGDRILAGFGMAVLSPLLLGVALTVRICMGSPVLFRQQRIGRGGRSFPLLKFRTMTRQRGGPGLTLPDEQRLTRLGRWLRATSLDELPQLWNVMRGDMSLVGPRPLLPEYLPRYNEWQRRRHEVKPGITGWAQIHGRNSLDWERRFELDVWYVDHWSLWQDAKILGRTLWSVIRRDGISRSSHATMPEFMGTKEPKGA